MWERSSGNGVHDTRMKEAEGVKTQAYLKAGKTKKSATLDDFCESTGYCRRHASLRGEPHDAWTSHPFLSCQGYSLYPFPFLAQE